METKFINVCERYDNYEHPITIADYQELSPWGIFEIHTDEIRDGVAYDGIFELYDDYDETCYERVAEDGRLLNYVGPGLSGVLERLYRQRGTE